jgi:hypothetical protein
VTDPDSAAAALLSYLGVDASPGTVAAIRERLGEELPELRDHVTSDGPAASIGRWQRDLSADVLAQCERSLGPALEAFGYS